MNFWSEIQAAPPMLLMITPTDVECRRFSLPQPSAVGTCSKFCCMGSSINRCFGEFSSQYQHFVIAVGDKSHIKFHFYLTVCLQRFKRRKKTNSIIISKWYKSTFSRVFWGFFNVCFCNFHFLILFLFSKQ